MMFNDFYKDKSVLITGHTGFKGSWLALWLHELGAKVTGLALPPNTEPSHFELIRLQDLIDHNEGDIRDGDLVGRIFARVRPEIVFHLAARALVVDSYDDPKATFDTNIGGTVNVLEAIRNCPSVTAAVVITSDKCYENKEWIWGYRESDPLGGHDPYSASKGAAEIVCAAYLRSFFAAGGRSPQPGFATARAGNVIGGGDWSKYRIIPDCINALSRQKPILVRNPHAVRPWQHVLDPLFGYLLLAKRLLEDAEKFSGAWNFGPSASGQVEVINLVEKIVASWGDGKIEILPAADNGLHEESLLRLSIEKAVNELHWKPILEYGAATDWTVDWYKAWYGKCLSLRRLSQDQIAAFDEIARAEGF